MLLQILRMPLFQLPQLISQLVNAQVAIQRLREFLAAAEQYTMAESPPSGPGAHLLPPPPPLPPLLHLPFIALISVQNGFTFSLLNFYLGRSSALCLLLFGDCFLSHHRIVIGQ